jgi:hypothetical protein
MILPDARSISANAPLDSMAAVEVSLKDLGLVSIAFRMLLPDQRIAGSLEESAEILRLERPNLDEISFQGWLKVKVHGCVAYRSIQCARLLS